MARRTTEYASFLRRLRRARLERGLSQTEVGRRLGKPQSYVSKSESGERRVDVIELLAFGRIYGVPLGSFVEERGYGREGAASLRRVAESGAGRRKRGAR